MPRRRIQAVDAGGYTFYFTYDRRRTDALHIELRGSITAQTVIDAFFEGFHWWNEMYSRYECYNGELGVYWTWLYGDESSTNVLVISCFPHPED